LVDVAGSPKLLDFGIAKLLAAEGDGESSVSPRTRTGLLLMTPEYAAPEQVRGEPVTTATDVFALGILLYQLLTGRRPFDLEGKSPSEIEQIVCHRLPAAPSSSPESLVGSLARPSRRDLDWIVAKALEKEPQRRYRAVGELADDVERVLSGHPVRARPATRRYRVARFVRRHRWGVAAVASIAGVVLAGAVLLALQQRQTLVERNRAQLEAAKAREVTDFLLGLFAATHPAATLGETVTARDLLDRGRERVASFDGPALVRAGMQGAIGRAYQLLGVLDEADVLAQASLQALEQEGASPLEIAGAVERLATLRGDQGRWLEAEPLMRRVLELRRAELPEHDPLVAQGLQHLGVVLRLLGRFEEAEAALREAIVIRRSSAAPGGSTELVESLGSLGSVLGEGGQLAASEETLREALAIAERIFPAGHPDRLTAMNNLATVLDMTREYEASLVLKSAVVEERRRVLGDRHPQTAAALSNLGQLLMNMGRLDEAEAPMREALAIDRELHGERSPDVAISLGNLGRLKHLQGKLEEAVPLHEAALSIRRELLGASHPQIANSLRSLGWVLRDRGELDAARPLLAESIAMRRQLLGEDHPALAEVLDLLGVLEHRAGAYARAEPLLLEALRIREARRPPGHPDIAATSSHLAELYAVWGRGEEVER
jgi:serine/threonine-protein kinase